MPIDFFLQPESVHIGTCYPFGFYFSEQFVRRARSPNWDPNDLVINEEKLWDELSTSGTTIISSTITFTFAEFKKYLDKNTPWKIFP